MRVKEKRSGVGLWHDVRRKMRRDRAARWSGLFLGCVALLSLFVPFLPLRSPTAIDLQESLSPPVWAFWSEAAGEEEPALELQSPGRAPTRRLAGCFDDGWSHRAVLEVQADAAATEELVLCLTELSKRRVSRSVRPTANGPEARHFLALPLRADDRPRTDWFSTGRGGKVQAWRVALAPGGSAAWLSLEAPLDPRLVAGWELAQEGERSRLVFATSAGERLGWSFELEGKLPDRIAGVDLSGVSIPRRQEAGLARAATIEASASTLVDETESSLERERWLGATLGEPIARSIARTLAETSEDGRITFASSDAERDLLRIDTAIAREELGRDHADLGQRLADALAASSSSRMQAARVVGLHIENSGRDLSRFDRALEGLRARTFGLWQTTSWLGTDSKGRDLLSRILWGSRTSILVALAASACSLLIGVLYGAVAGLVGGRVDELMMRLVDVLYAVPFTFVVIFLITLLGAYRAELAAAGIDRDMILYAVIGAVFWLTMARVVRGQVLSLERTEFMQAARVLGSSTPRILFTHVVPNVMSVVIVYLTLTIPQVMLFEAFLSFLGLGVEEPQVSWGLLARDTLEAISPLRLDWWMVLFPALAMGSTLLALGILGDGLRDALDPRSTRPRAVSAARGGT
jgi:oligopeptide transport system permease protein